MTCNGGHDARRLSYKVVIFEENEIGVRKCIIGYTAFYVQAFVGFLGIHIFRNQIREWLQVMK